MPVSVFGRKYIPAVVGGLDPATTAWINAVNTTGIGGTVSTTQQGRVDTLIKALKAHSIWPLLDRLWLFAGESISQQATIDIVNLAVGTNHSMTLGASGYAGNGTSAYFDTAYIPQVTTTTFDTTKGALGVYQIINNTAGSSELIGAQTGGSACAIWANTTGSNFYDVSGGWNGTFTFSSSQGFWVAYRSDSSHIGLDRYRSGGVDNFTNSSTGLAFNNFSLTVGAYNNQGTIGSWSTDTFAAAFMGNLTSAQGATLSSDLNAYMTAWGVNVY